MAILDDVKLALRLKSTAYDGEINGIIAAAKLDLEGPGVAAANIDDTDEFIKRAIIIYAKANFGMANPDMDKYDKAYDKIKTHLATNKSYTVAPEV